MIILADFHLHSCLSPCGDLSMSPRAIAAGLTARGVDLAAITDHNSSLNAPAFGQACREADITPLFGIEAQSREECHILCLFADAETARILSDELYAAMPPVMNIPEKMGDQVFVDDEENILGEVNKYLVTSADLSLETLAARARELGGLVIPAHVDRPSFSLTSQLGLIVDGPWDALEVVSMPGSPGADPALDTRGYPLITSSDAHYPEHIGRRAFQLDMNDTPLCDKTGRADIEAIRAALSRRPRA